MWTIFFGVTGLVAAYLKMEGLTPDLPSQLVIAWLALGFYHWGEDYHLLKELHKNDEYESEHDK